MLLSRCTGRCAPSQVNRTILLALAHQGGILIVVAWVSFNSIVRTLPHTLLTTSTVQIIDVDGPHTLCVAALHTDGSCKWLHDHCKLSGALGFALNFLFCFFDKTWTCALSCRVIVVVVQSSYKHHKLVKGNIVSQFYSICSHVHWTMRPWWGCLLLANFNMPSFHLPVTCICSCVYVEYVHLASCGFLMNQNSASQEPQVRSDLWGYNRNIYHFCAAGACQTFCYISI